MSDDINKFCSLLKTLFPTRVLECSDIDKVEMDGLLHDQEHMDHAVLTPGIK